MHLSVKCMIHFIGFYLSYNLIVFIYNLIFTHNWWLYRRISPTSPFPIFDLNSFQSRFMLSSTQLGMLNQLDILILPFIGFSTKSPFQHSIVRNLWSSGKEIMIKNFHQKTFILQKPVIDFPYKITNSQTYYLHLQGIY